MKRTTSLYVQDILETIGAIERFVFGYSYDAFIADEKPQYAVIRGFTIIGEATKHVPSSARARAPGVPWSDMAGMRDRVVHGYPTVDLRIAWRAIQEDFPRLKPQLEALLMELRAEEDEAA